MAAATNRQDGLSETTHSTKRVFMRAEREDRIIITDVVENSGGENIPDTATVVQRNNTYYGPKLRIEAPDKSEQYLLTAPGPQTQAIFWCRSGSDWQEVAEVCLDFDGSVPQYDICLHCGEPLSTIAHQRRSVIGACENS
jgi:hypothetical protein